MQNNHMLETHCHYPDCTAVAVKRCKKCHQTFCEQHIHRRWWGGSICEICRFLKGAGKAPRANEKEEITAEFEMSRRIF